MKQTHIAVLYIPLLFTLTINALSVDSTFLHHCDSLIALDNENQMTSVTSTKQTHTVFQSITVKTINCPFHAFQVGMRQWHRYISGIRYVKRVVPVTVDPVDSMPNSIFIEVGVFLAVSWFMGDVSFEYPHDSNELYVYLKQNCMDPLYGQLKADSHGALKIEYHDFIIWYYIKDLGNRQTRIALIALVEPKVWIPGWLFKITAKTVFPGMLKKIEDMIRKNQ